MPQDLGQWLAERAADRGEQPIKFAPPANRRGPEFWFAIAASLMATIASLGWLWLPYHPVRTAMLTGAGLGTLLVAFLGLYIAGFAFLRQIPLSFRLTGPLFLVSCIFAGGNAGYELWKRATDAELDRNGVVVPDLEIARARGWVPPKAN